MAVADEEVHIPSHLTRRNGICAADHGGRVQMAVVGRSSRAAPGVRLLLVPMVVVMPPVGLVAGRRGVSPRGALVGGAVLARGRRGPPSVLPRVAPLARVRAQAARAVA